MLDMLVIEKDEKLARKIINEISKSNKNIRLYSFCTTSNEAIQILESEKIDFILLDIEFEIKVLQYLIKENKKEYFNSIILISNKKINHCPFIFEYIKKPINFQKLLDSITNISNYKEKSNIYLIMQNKIINELKHLNYNLSHIGTKYLIETILEIYLKKDYLGDNLKNNIYCILAEKYNKPINTIYGDIKQATINMYANCEEKIIINYFCFKVCRKPKVKEVIFRVINKIKKTSPED